MVEPRGTLIISSRLHGEIRVPLEQTSIVGRSIASDIVVGDQSLAPAHLRVEVDDTPTVQLTALDGDIVLDDGGRLAAGDSCTLSRSAGFHAGDVPIRIELLGVVDESAKVSQPRRMMPFVLATVLLGSTAFATTEGSSLPSRAARAGGAFAPPTIVTVEPSPSELPLHVRATTELRRLEMADIVLVPLSDGALRASGTLFDTQAARWADFKKWLDVQSGGGLVLVDAVTAGSKAPSLAIQSAWLGEAPYVIDGQGDKLFVGAVIENGWVIQSIEAGRVNVRRGRKEMAVRF